MPKSNLTEITNWYQTILKIAGRQPNLVVDGKFGKSTKHALECFQIISELEPSGVLDVPTNVALNQVAMEWIYRELIPGPLGKMTDELRNALKRFQRDYELEADGKVGPATRDVMVRVLRTELPSPLRFYHAHLGQGRPPGTPQPENLGLEAAPAVKPSGVIGDDDRTPTSKPLDRPFRWVCLVNPTYETAEVGFGSGLLISPSHVLTAAHVLLDEVDDGKGNRRLVEAARVRVCPGSDGRSRADRLDGNEPFGAWMGPRRHTPSCYKSFRSCDYALIELEKPIGDRDFELKLRGSGLKSVKKTVKLGYWGDSPGFEIRAVTQKALHGVKLFSAAYPQMFGKVQMRAFGSGIHDDLKERIRILSPDDYGNLLAHDADSTPGQSGGPLWRHVEQGGASVCQLVGVLIQRDRGINYAVALTEEVLTQIANWAPKTFQYSDGLLSVKT